MTGEVYLHFMHNVLFPSSPIMFPHVNYPDISNNSLWYQHDEAPAQYARQVREYLIYATKNSTVCIVKQCNLDDLTESIIATRCHHMYTLHHIYSSVMLKDAKFKNKIDVCQDVFQKSILLDLSNISRTLQSPYIFSYENIKQRRKRLKLYVNNTDACCSFINVWFCLARVGKLF